MTPLEKSFSGEKRDVYLVYALRAYTRYSIIFSATALFSEQSSIIMIDEVQAKVNPLKTTKQKNLANARTFLGQTIL
jgi:hypothetical protein